MKLNAYSGDKPFIFISYAHSDSDTVLPILNHLQENGFRVWFDQYIEIGTNWSQIIAEQVENSAVVMAFVSKNSVKSEFCNDEINFALNCRKKPILIYLEEAELNAGIKLRLDSVQAMFSDKYGSDAEFLDSLCNIKALEPCREAEDGLTVYEDNDELVPAEDAPDHELQAYEKEISFYKRVIGWEIKSTIIGLVLLAVMVATLWWLFNQEAKKQQHQQAQLTSTYNNWFDNRKIYTQFTLYSTDLTKELSVRYKNGKEVFNDGDFLSVSYVGVSEDKITDEEGVCGVFLFDPLAKRLPPVQDQDFFKKANDYRVCSEITLYLGDEPIAKGFVGDKAIFANAKAVKALQKLLPEKERFPSPYTDTSIWVKKLETLKIPVTVTGEHGEELFTAKDIDSYIVLNGYYDKAYLTFFIKKGVDKTSDDLFAEDSNLVKLQIGYNYELSKDFDDIKPYSDNAFTVVVSSEEGEKIGEILDAYNFR